MASPHVVNLPKKLDTLLEYVSLSTGETNETILLDWIQNPVNFTNHTKDMSDYNLIQLWTIIHHEDSHKTHQHLRERAINELKKRGVIINDIDNIRLEIISLNHRDDSHLWQLVETSLDNLRRVSNRMTKLTNKMRNEGLTETENEELETVTEAYDWYTLLRSKALLELQERGHDIQSYLERIAPK